MSAAVPAPDTSFDCLIIGGGPAGLTAAIYAARFHLSVGVVDAGGGRAAQIPCTRNHAGFPGGISGKALLSRMRNQAVEYGAAIIEGRVESLGGTIGAFTAKTAQTSLGARMVVLCTGVTNMKPQGLQSIHDRALSDGRLRYCAVCDGFEVTDQCVAVIGSGSRAVKEATFLRSYTARVTLIDTGGDECLSAPERDRLTSLGVEIASGLPRDYALVPGGLALTIGGERRLFEAVYPAMGSEIHSELAAGLSAHLTDEGCVKVDAHQRTSIAGLYAAGDVVVGLDQISHAMGEAGVAATTVRNDLAAAAPLLRGPR